jgi:hypothetical protein
MEFNKGPSCQILTFALLGENLIFAFAYKFVKVLEKHHSFDGKKGCKRETRKNRRLINWKLGIYLKPKKLTPTSISFI